MFLQAMKFSSFAAVSCFVSLTFSSMAHAQKGSGTSGGGSLTGLQVKKLFSQGISEVQSSLFASQFPELAANLKGLDLAGTLDNAKVEMTDQEIDVDIGNGQTQPSAASFDKVTHTILVNQEKVDHAPNLTIIESLGIHEVLGLLSLESTGVYTYSEKYLEMNGFHCHSNLCMNTPSAVFNADSAAEMFQFAAIPHANDVVGEYLPVHSVQVGNFINDLYLVTESNPNGTTIFEKKDYEHDVFYAERKSNSRFGKGGIWYSDETALFTFSNSSNDFGTPVTQVSIQAVKKASSSSVDLGNTQGPYIVDVSPDGTHFGMIRNMNDLREKKYGEVPTNSYSCRELNNKNLLCQVSAGDLPKVVKRSATPGADCDSVDRGGFAIVSLGLSSALIHCYDEYAPVTTGSVSNGPLAGYVLLKKIQ